MVARKQLDDIIMKNNAEDWWQPERFATYTKHLLPPELEVLLTLHQSTKATTVFSTS